MNHVWIITHGRPREGGDVIEVIDAEEWYAFGKFAAYIETTHNRHFSGPQAIEKRLNGDPYYYFDGRHEWFSLDRHEVTTPSH